VSPDVGTEATLTATTGCSRAELRERGRAARTARAHGDLAGWSPPAGRDPLAVLAATDRDRIPELVAVRYQRMAASPFAFLRGAAAVMAQDLGSMPSSGLHVQLCGDAHIANFGVFATPERRTVFDVNDFDETLPGPFEWDVMRLAASCVVVAAAAAGRRSSRPAAVATAAVQAYSAEIDQLEGQSTFDIWYSTIDVDALLADPATWHTSETVARDIARSATRTNLAAFDQLTAVVGGRRVIVDDPPLVTHSGDAEELGGLHGFHRAYGATLPAERRALLERFEVIDAARKAVGVGSVGTRCYLLLLEGSADGEPLLLQVKQAQPSILEAVVGRSPLANHAERVVRGQRLLQSATDPLLGWARFGDIDVHVRQLWDRKGGMNLADVGPRVLTRYAELCGAALARAHARSSHPSLLRGYLGNGSRFSDAVTAFATAYAAQTAHDHAALTAARADGHLSG